MGLYDSTRRWPNADWNFMFEVEGGMKWQTVYIPFANGLPRFRGLDCWWIFLNPWQWFNAAETTGIVFYYTKYDYIFGLYNFFFTTKNVANYVVGDFDFRFKDIKAYKLK